MRLTALALVMFVVFSACTSEGESGDAMELQETTSRLPVVWVADALDVTGFGFMRMPSSRFLEQRIGDLCAVDGHEYGILLSFATGLSWPAIEVSNAMAVLILEEDLHETIGMDPTCLRRLGEATVEAVLDRNLGPCHPDCPLATELWIDVATVEITDLWRLPGIAIRWYQEEVEFDAVAMTGVVNMALDGALASDP